MARGPGADGLLLRRPGRRARVRPAGPGAAAGHDRRAVRHPADRLPEPSPAHQEIHHRRPVRRRGDGHLRRGVPAHQRRRRARDRGLDPGAGRDRDTGRGGRVRGAAETGREPGDTARRDSRADLRRAGRAHQEHRRHPPAPRVGRPGHLGAVRAAGGGHPRHPDRAERLQRGAVVAELAGRRHGRANGRGRAGRRRLSREPGQDTVASGPATARRSGRGHRHRLAQPLLPGARRRPPRIRPCRRRGSELHVNEGRRPPSRG